MVGFWEKDMTDISVLRQRMSVLLDRYRSADESTKREQASLLAAVSEHSNSEDAQKIIQAVALKVQQDAHLGMSSVVSRCLETVFDDPYEFELRFEQKRGKTEAHIVLVRKELVCADPLHEVGGGVVDVAAFALRLASLVLERPAKRKVLVLDEPFGNLRGAHHRKKMRALVQSLAEEFGVQIIVNIDHEQFPEFLTGGKVIELE